MKNIHLTICELKKDIDALEKEIAKYNPGINVKDKTPLPFLVADAGKLALLNFWQFPGRFFQLLR